MRISIKRALCAENLTGIGPLATDIFPVKVASRRKIIIIVRKDSRISIRSSAGSGRP